MIEILQGLPDNVVGLVVKGRVTPNDCAEVLLPAIEKSREWHHRLRLYYEIRSRYPGATWPEMTLDSERAALWERIAVVTDVALVRHALQAVRLLIPGELRVFSTAQIPEGLAWITEMPSYKRRAASAAAAGVRRERQLHPPAQYLHQAF